jgi:RNA polymerase sigma factor (sigma-70 family)
MDVTPSPFTPFYAIASGFDFIQTSSSPIIRVKWQLNQQVIGYLSSICQIHITDFEIPKKSSLAQIDVYLQQQINLSPCLINQVTLELYQSLQSQFIASAAHSAWINFVQYMAVKLACNLWHRLPPLQRNEERFHQFHQASLFPPENLFNNFNHKHNQDLLSGIERWTYRVLRNFIYSEIRTQELYFGLSNLGVVSKSSPFCIRKTLNGSIPEDRIELDIFLVKVFKEYLKRSTVRTNHLQASDWEIIYQECSNLWNRSYQPLFKLSIDDIQSELNFVGKCVRHSTDVSIISLDCQIASSENYTLADTIVSQQVNSVYETDAAMLWAKAYSELLVIVSQIDSQLDSRDKKIMKLYYEDSLNQTEIAAIFSIDAGTVSRRLRAFSRKIIAVAYQQIEHPDGTKIGDESTALKAIKEILRKFYQVNRN